jgi:hypothetical protein
MRAEGVRFGGHILGGNIVDHIDVGVELICQRK